MKTLFYFISGCLLFIFFSCDESINRLEVFSSLDPGPTPILPCEGCLPKDTLPEKPIVPLTDYEKGYQDAINEVIEHLLEYAKIEKVYYVVYHIDRGTGNVVSSYDLDGLWLSFLNVDSWVKDRIRFINSYDIKNETNMESMKGYYWGLKHTLYDGQMPILKTDFLNKLG
mgnify:CR=1 FL=1